MFSFPRTLAALALAGLAAAALAQNQQSYPGIGRDATPREVAAWDIDVRPDFKGLPPGSGSVNKGQEVWEAKCATCHGVFGESNQVFNPLVGGTTADDIKTGHVAMLLRKDYPGRTTMMKVSTLSTLWDYINRAMPWSQPKSLSTDDVYAVTAYLLNLADVLPAEFTLSDRNIREVQQRMPNRNGTTVAHALWPGTEFGGKNRPDVVGTACMANCEGEPKVASMLPAFALNAHGNLADQNRIVGPQRGIDTGRGAAAPNAGTTVAVAQTQSSSTPSTQQAAPAAAASGAHDSQAIQSLTQKNNCITCHAIDRKVVGPSWKDIAKKHEGKADYLAGKIRSGGSGVWGAIPMPPQTLTEEEARRIASWLAAGAGS